ncbi:acyl carrier protein [Streptomyces sp. S.PB5]|uniref:acyl carrier protein n=1 Tax=unclassified Streptomyces TaxID=2593676 RepID=UPI0025B1F8D8|nr:acyl carrier protein [Streptomyces sp. S.PB5]MDN3022224.1 acyl carrier protein [Streptomyces sp. S.PB5]
MTVPSTHTERTLTDWLAQRVAEYLRTPPSEIDPAVPLAQYGLDSVAALSLCGDVEDAFGVQIDPTAAWDYPTVRALAGHLLSRLEATP